MELQGSASSDEMLVALAVWLCSLPLVALLTGRLFGLVGMTVAALIVLIALMVICWGMCGWKAYRSRRS